MVTDPRPNVIYGATKCRIVVDEYALSREQRESAATSSASNQKLKWLHTKSSPTFYTEGLVLAQSTPL